MSRHRNCIFQSGYDLVERGTLVVGSKQWALKSKRKIWQRTKGCEAGTKGQLISKCPFGFIVWTKIPTKLFLDFCPEFFCSFLGASWKLFGLPGDLVCNIINKEACRKPQKASRKPPGRYKKFQGRNSEIISLVILSKRWNQRDILKLTDLYLVSNPIWDTNGIQIKISRHVRATEF